MKNTISKPEHTALWDKYEPANLAIRLAGWEPVTHALFPLRDAVQLQRFGRGDEIYLTVWGPEHHPLRSRSKSRPPHIGLKEKPSLSEIVSDTPMEVGEVSPGWKLTLPMEKNMTRVIRIR